MPVPAQSYVWFRLRHVVGLWVARATNLASTAVLYDMQNQPRPPLPYVGLTRRDFPFVVSDDELITEVTTSVTVDVTAASVGETVALVLFGTRYAYTLVGGDDATVARDALLALITADLCRIVAAADAHPYAVGFQPCTATGVGASSITFAGLGLGPVRLAVIEGCSVAASTQAYRAIQAGLRRAVVRLDLYWPTRQSGFDTIDEYAEALRSSLTNRDTAAWLASRGVGVEEAARISIQEASAVSGGASQRRKFFDVIFNAMSKVYRSGDATIDATEQAVVEIFA